MQIITRSEWGSRYPNGFGPRRLPATQAWLHHSATIAPDLVPPFDDDHAAIRAIEAIGQQRFGGGISYTRLFTPAGLIFEGHSIGRVGSHTANRNSVAVGYCLVGNYDGARPTDAQLRALAWCLQHDWRHGWLDAPRLDGGHRDLKSTACPGRHAYAQIGEINRLAAGPPITDSWDLGGFLMALSDAEQRFVHDRIAGMLPQRYYVIVDSGVAVEVTADHPGAKAATVLDTLDGDFLRRQVVDLETKLTAPAPVDLTDAQLDALADKVAARLNSLRFVANPEGS